MADGSRARKMGDRLIFEPRVRFDLLREATEAGAQNNAGPRLLEPMLADDGNGFGDLICEMEHSRQLT